MSLTQTLLDVAVNQARNLRNVVAGYPVRLVPLGSMTLDPDDVAIAREWLAKPSEWHEPEVVARYGAEFAGWNGSQYGYAFMGGRVALSAAIDALELKTGDEVIVPGYTCIVVPNAYHYVGVTVVYSDIELDTYGPDVDEVRKKITPRTRAIHIQHMYGLVCRDYEALLDLARSRNLKVIDDCAHSAGAEYEGVRVGNRGDVAIYSSEQSKILNTVHGGVATTNDPDLARRLQAYYDRAPEPEAERIDRMLHTLLVNYEQCKGEERWWRRELLELQLGDKRTISTTREEEQGIRPANYGCKMGAPIAAIGSNQLRKIDAYNDQRRQTAKRWDRWCDENGYAKPVVIEDSLPVFLRYPVMVEPEKKQNSRWANRGLGVELGVWNLSETHPVPAKIPDCPNAARAVRECVNFPTLLR
jgi:perosamine synthetase